MKMAFSLLLAGFIGILISLVVDTTNSFLSGRPLNFYKDLQLFTSMGSFSMPMKISEKILMVEIDIDFISNYARLRKKILQDLDFYSDRYQETDVPFYQFYLNIVKLTDDIEKEYKEFGNYSSTIKKTLEPPVIDIQTSISTTEFFEYQNLHNGRYMSNIIKSLIQSCEENLNKKANIKLEETTTNPPNPAVLNDDITDQTPPNWLKCSKLPLLPEYNYMILGLLYLQNLFTEIRTNIRNFNMIFANLVNGNLDYFLIEKMESNFNKSHLSTPRLFHIKDNMGTIRFYFKSFLGEDFRIFSRMAPIPYQGKVLNLNLVNHDGRYYELDCIEDNFCIPVDPKFDKQCITAIQNAPRDAFKMCPFQDSRQKFKILDTGILLVNLSQIEMDKINSQTSLKDFKIEQLPLIIQNSKNLSICLDGGHITILKARALNENYIMSSFSDMDLSPLHYIQSTAEMIFDNYFVPGTFLTIMTVVCTGVIVGLILWFCQLWILKCWNKSVDSRLNNIHNLLKTDNKDNEIELQDIIRRSAIPPTAPRF